MELADVLRKVAAATSLLDSGVLADQSDGMWQLARLLDEAGEHVPMIGQFLRETEALPVVFEVLREPHIRPKLAMHTLVVIGNLCSTAVDPEADETKKQLRTLEHSAVKAVKAFVMSDNEGVRLYAVAALQNMTSDAGLCRDAVDLGAVSLIEKIIEELHPRRGTSDSVDRLYSLCAGVLVNVSENEGAATDGGGEKPKSRGWSVARKSRKPSGAMALGGVGQMAVRWRKKQIGDKMMDELRETKVQMAEMIEQQQALLAQMAQMQAMGAQHGQQRASLAQMQQAGQQEQQQALLAQMMAAMSAMQMGGPPEQQQAMLAQMQQMMAAMQVGAPMTPGAMVGASAPSEQWCPPSEASAAHSAARSAAPSDVGKSLWDRFTFTREASGSTVPEELTVLKRRGSTVDESLGRSKESIQEVIEEQQQRQQEHTTTTTTTTTTTITTTSMS